MLRSKIIHIIFLIIVTAGVYANSLGGDFVYDDKPMIVTYDFIKDTGNIPATFTSSTSLYGNTNYYRPMQTVTYITDYYLWGEFPAGFHLTNLIFHILAVVGIYIFISILFGDGILAFIAALMFAVHPVHTTVVSYIAGRADSIFTLFMMLSLIFYITFRYRKRSRVSYLCALIFFVCALTTKELAMIIPLVIIAIDKYAYRYTSLDASKKNDMDYVPFLAVLVFYVWFRATQMSFFAKDAMPPFPFENRLITAPYVLAQYLRMMILPYDLHMGRQPWVASTLADGRIILSLGVVAAFIFIAYRQRKKEKPVWFGTCWFILMIFPSLNIITPLFYTIAENWLYVPSIGLFLIIAYVVKRLYRTMVDNRNIAGKYIVIFGTIFFVIVMATMTILHNRTWKDEITLGENSLRFSPREFKIYNNMGVVYLGRGELDKAEESFKKCLEIKPDTGMAYFNLYRVYMARGQRAQALESLRKARELDPKRVSILINKMGIKD